MAHQVTNRELCTYKLLFPNDSKLQALTLEELQSKTDGGIADWSDIPNEATSGEQSWSCSVATGFIAADCFSLVLGAESLRAATTESKAEAVAKAVQPLQYRIQQYAKTLSHKGASRTDLAKAVFGVVQSIYSSGCLGPALAALFGGMSWHQGVLFGAASLDTIMRAVSTDGSAVVAMLMIQLATADYLISDSIKCAEAYAENG